MAMLMGRRPTGGEVGTTLTIVELDEMGRLLLPASLRRKLGARRFEVGLVAGRAELAPIQDVKALEGKYKIASRTLGEVGRKQEASIIPFSRVPDC
jgi:bifunctional DNA-binding transcriptional regulator/antitoxin component of YhaV-PrlF toxin-antitoxin module